MKEAVRQNTDSEIRMPEFAYWVHHLQGVWSPAIYLTSLWLRFNVWEVCYNHKTYIAGVFWTLTELIHTWSANQCLVYSEDYVCCYYYCCDYIIVLICYIEFKISETKCGFVGKELHNKGNIKVRLWVGDKV